MKRLYFAILGFLLCFSSPLSAQDVHFTLYDLTPLTFNPAYTGAFYGSVRVGGIFRDQWATVTGFGNDYKTPSLYADSPLIKGFREKDWVGVGMTLYQDKSGSLGLSNGSVKLSAAYFLTLDKNGNSVISLGYQTGSVAQRIKNPEDATFGDELEGTIQMSEDRSALMDAKSNYLEHTGGIRFAQKINPTDFFVLGFSVAHIGNPNVQLLRGAGGGGRRYEVPLRFVGQAQYRTAVSDKLAIAPSVFVQSFGKAREIVAQGMAHYLLNPEKGTILNAGLGYRVGDAVQVLLGLDIKEIKFMFGYDVNVSALTPASNTFGGIEISLTYIGKIYKRPNPDRVIFCPRF